MSVATPEPADRSILRKARRGGDTSRDGRGRFSSGPAILHYGFRPFFFAGALYAALAIPLWLSAYLLGFTLPGPFVGAQWHAHEMIFGFAGAVIAGFVLTAVPNWTGRLPLSGLPLGGLIGLWLLGRFASALVPAPVLAMLLDLAFPVTLAFVVWREVVAGRNWRNAPVAAMLSLFAIADLVQHGEAAGLVPDGMGSRMALAIVAMLIALIGGRVVPSFTRNWLAKQSGQSVPAEFGRLDKLALLATAAAMLSWVFLPDTVVAGVILACAGTLLVLRLSRWRGWLTLAEPIVAILHVGYGWLAIALILLGASVLRSDPALGVAAVHALATGAIGTMTLAVMTRASLGHTGRAIVADRWTVAIYAFVTIGAMLRVAAPLLPDLYVHMLGCGGLFWSGAFLLFAVGYAPVLWRPRLAG
jgi:uncharacterized protein involved in response to NO